MLIRKISSLKKSKIPKVKIENCLEMNPMFIDPENHDFRLQDSSPGKKAIGGDSDLGVKMNAQGKPIE